MQYSDTIHINTHMMSVIGALAQHKHVSVPHLVEELLQEALDNREDKIWSKMADDNDVDDSLGISHENAWK